MSNAPRLCGSAKPVFALLHLMANPKTQRGKEGQSDARVSLLERYETYSHPVQLTCSSVDRPPKVRLAID